MNIYHQNEPKRPSVKSGRLIAQISTMLLGALTFAGCGNLPKNDKTTSTESTSTSTTAVSTSSTSKASSKTSVQASKPSDSSGLMSSVSLNAQTADYNQSAGLALATLDMGNGIIVDNAKIVVGLIKIKADKDESNEEKELAKEKVKELVAEKESIKSEKEAWEKSFEEEKKKFEESKSQAKTEGDKKAAESAWEAKKATLEANKAKIFAALEQARADREAARDSNLKWQGPYIYDAVSGSFDKELPKAQVYDGSYKRIEFKIVPLRSSATESDPLLNRSILLGGSVAVGNSSLPFSINITKDEEFKLMGDGAVKVLPDQDNQIGLVFDLKAGFDAIGLASIAADSATGTILIDADHNADKMELFLKAMKKSLKFGKDNDGDGKVEDAEKAGDGLESAQSEDSAESDSEDSLSE